MTALSAAVSVETVVDIDWSQLGRHYGEHLTSRDQAAFLLGVYEVISDLQLALIGAESAFGGDRREVALVLEALSSHIRGGES